MAPKLIDNWEHLEEGEEYLIDEGDEPARARCGAKAPKGKSASFQFHGDSYTRECWPQNCKVSTIDH